MSKARILIADDETNIRMMLRVALTSDGYLVEEARDGREALDCIRASPPDVLLLDLSMPLLDGMGVLEQLRGMRTHGKVKPIVLTAYGAISTAVRATRLGAVDFLEKPVAPVEVREAVEAALNEPVVPHVEPHDDPLAGGYEGVLERVRKSLRLAQYTTAETLLMKAADLSHRDAVYYNLLGVLYEAQRQWRLARKFYGKAISFDKHYEPAQANMRRLYELQTFGRTTIAVALGDEPDILFARMPDGRFDR